MEAPNDPYQQPDAAATTDPGAFQGEEFTLLDVKNGQQPATASLGFPSNLTDGFGAPVTPAPDNMPMSMKLSRFALASANAFISCSALAIAKQIINPANYSQTEQAAQEATKQLPEWFAAQYKSRRLASDLTRNIVKDTSVLMAATGTWYGVQAGMKAVRGVDDAVNVCAAGSISAALLGATFIEPFKLPRVGLWGAVGGLAGYFGYKEQQALKAALLERQQELEKKHLHKDDQHVEQKLNSRLLKKLLEMEQQEQLDQLKARVDAANKPAAVRPDGSVQDGWQHLINNPPWLQEQAAAGSSGNNSSSSSGAAGSGDSSTAAASPR